MKLILVVEDDKYLNNAYVAKLSKVGFEVRTALDGEEAIDVLNQVTPDLIILDLVMPKKDGFEVIKEVRSNAENKTLPIIVLSNLGGDEDIKKALELGANDYFVKTQHPMSEIVEKSKKYESRG